LFSSNRRKTLIGYFCFFIAWGMAFLPEVSFPGLWSGKDDRLFSRIQVEGADISRQKMTKDNA
jgi:hypothetical protein